MRGVVEYVQVPERAGGLGRDDAAPEQELLPQEPEVGRGKEDGANLPGLVVPPHMQEQVAAGEQGVVAPEGHTAANGSEAAGKVRGTELVSRTPSAASVLPASSRALRQTAPTKDLVGGLYFTPDGRSLVHGGSVESDDKELSLWDLRTAKRTVGLERTGGIICSAISPGGRRLCV
eukprot:COSAG04_NODE_8920_length_917_cov_1.134474_1_plen_175_part_10